MFNNRKNAHQQHGFTLIEVMIALFIFTVIMLGLAKGEIAALLTQNGNQFRDEALRLAEDEVGQLQSEQFSITGTSPALAQAPWTAPVVMTVKMRGGTATFSRSVQITDIAASSTALKRIDVAVGWTQGNSAVLLAPTNMNHQTSLSTVIVRGD